MRADADQHMIALLALHRSSCARSARDALQQPTVAVVGNGRGLEDYTGRELYMFLCLTNIIKLFDTIRYRIESGRDASNNFDVAF